MGIYTVTLPRGTLDLAGEIYYEAENLLYISAAGREYDAYLDQKTLLNASITYTADSNRNFVRANGSKLSDELYRISSQSVATLWTLSQFGGPLYYGIEFGFNFGGG
jgi:iron complex outermembrane receptor protein